VYIVHASRLRSSDWNVIGRIIKISTKLPLVLKGS